MTTPVEVAVYEPDGATFVAVVPRREGVRWNDENNGVGFGQFGLHLDDQILVDHPALLTPFSVVKVKPAGAPDYVYGWQIEQLAPVQVSIDENAGRRVAVSGRQVRSLLETAAVDGPGDHRTFDFSAMDVPGWPGDWTVPYGVTAAADTTSRHNQPVGFPDDDAEWISHVDPTTSRPAERMWLRTDVTAIADVEVKVWASCDNSMSLRINGEPIITTDPADRFAWRKTFEWTGTLLAGNNVISAWVDNAAQLTDNPSALRFVMGTATASGGLDTVIVRSDTVAWKAHGPVDPPGWPAAAILIKLLEEAQAAGDLNPAITWDFTATHDSNGDAWVDAQDLQIPIDEDLLTTSNRWAGTVFDIHMTPELVLQAWIRRGGDLSGTVELTAGVDVTALAPTAAYGPIRNVARVRYPGGVVEVVDAASVAAYGRRVMPIAAGDIGTAEQATALAAAALNDTAAPQVTLPVESNSAKGKQPYADYHPGDTISAPALFVGQAAARVMGVTGVEADNWIDWTTDVYPETA